MSDVANINTAPRYTLSLAHFYRGGLSSNSNQYPKDIRPMADVRLQGNMGLGGYISRGLLLRLVLLGSTGHRWSRLAVADGFFWYRFLFLS